MSIKRISLFLGLVLMLALLSACSFPWAVPPTPTVPFAAYTAAAQTVAVQFTMAALGTQIMQPTATATNVVILPTDTPVPTNTPLPPTNTPPPTSTPVPPSPTPIPIPCDRAGFVKDVTYPDDTEVPAGTSFTKTWRLKNNGSCTWTSGYAIVFDGGDAMNGPASAQLTNGVVPPGEVVDVSITLKAPDAAGNYKGNWKLRNANGLVFGIGDAAAKSFWVQIKSVIPITPTPTGIVGFDFVAQGPNAQWRNATTSLPWGDQNSDTPGIATNLGSSKLNDGKTYNNLLATYPQRIDNGIITGVYPSYTVQNGDHFRTILGFRADCANGKVRFRLIYIEAGVETIMGEWVKACDNTVLPVDLDMASIKGRTVQFALWVGAEGSSDDDKAIWVSPRVQR